MQNSCCLCMDKPNTSIFTADKLDLHKKGKMPLNLLYHSLSHYGRRKLEENDETKHHTKPGFNCFMLQLRHFKVMKSFRKEKGNF